MPEKRMRRRERRQAGHEVGRAPALFLLAPEMKKAKGNYELEYHMLAHINGRLASNG